MQTAAKTKTLAGRAVERVKLQGRAHLALADDIEQPPLDIQLEDLSIHGAGFTSPITLPVGMPIVLLLHPLNRAQGSIRGRILNCRPLPNHHFRIGMEFDTPGGPTLRSIRHAFYPDDALNDRV